MDNIYVHFKKAKPQSKNVVVIENAYIEDIFTESLNSGNILITYDMTDDKGMSHTQQLRLNVGPNTIIHTPLGEDLNFYSLEKGMVINAIVSSAMTRSIPPQSSAYQITVLPDEDFVYTTIDRVVEVDPKNGFLYTGNPTDMADQMRFVISDATVILDRYGNRIRLEKIRPGQMVQVEHAIFQTPSIPPQTTAFKVQIK